MNEKIKSLKEEIFQGMKEPWGNGRTPFEILEDVLSIIEDHDACLRVKDNPNKAAEEPCCGEFKTCNKSCSPRADYFKDNSRSELNKLALSILKESLKDEGYRLCWEANIAMAFYDAYDIRAYNDYEHRSRGAKLFMERLFGEIE